MNSPKSKMPTQVRELCIRAKFASRDVTEVAGKMQVHGPLGLELLTSFKYPVTNDSQIHS